MTFCCRAHLMQQEEGGRALFPCCPPSLVWPLSSFSVSLHSSLLGGAAGRLFFFAVSTYPLSFHVKRRIRTFASVLGGNCLRVFCGASTLNPFLLSFHVKLLHGLPRRSHFRAGGAPQRFLLPPSFACGSLCRRASSDAPVWCFDFRLATILIFSSFFAALVSRSAAFLLYMVRV